MDFRCKKFPYEERTLFLMGLTFVGGYINTYAYIARGGNFVSYHTGNMIRLSLAAAQGNMELVVFHLIPILMCILGGCLAALVRNIIKRDDWRFHVLCLEALFLVALAFLPHTFDKYLNYSLSVFAGAHFFLFRSWEGMPFNISAATGNLRSFAICFSDAWNLKEAEIIRFVRFLILFFAFPIGAYLGALISFRINELASLPIAVVTIVWALMYRKQITK